MDRKLNFYINFQYGSDNYLLDVVNQGDKVTLLCEFYSNGAYLDVLNKNIQVDYLKADGTTVSIAGMKYISKSGNSATIKLPVECTNVIGDNKCQVVVTSEDESVSSFPIKIKVKKSVFEGSRNGEGIATVLNEFHKATANAADVINNVENLAHNLATKEEVKKVDDIKMNKSDTITMANLGQDVKEAMTGGSTAVVGPHAVNEININDNQVTARKISIVEGEFPIEIQFIMGKIIQPGGTEQDNSSYYITGYIPVESSTYYSLNAKSAVRYYDSSKNFIEGGSTVDCGTFTTPNNCSYLRFTSTIESLQSQTIDNFILVKGTDVKNKDDFDQYIKSEYIKNINEDSVDFLRKSVNLFGYTTVTLENAVYPGDDGRLYENSGQNASDYIPVTAGLKYVCNLPLSAIAFYNANKVCLGMSSIGGTGGLPESGGTGGLKDIDAGTTITMPALSNGVKCCYVRISIKQQFAYNGCQFQQGDTPTDFEPYGKYFLSKSIVQKENESSSDVYARFKNKKWTALGDSHTQQGYYTSQVVNKLNLNLTNKGYGGSTIADNETGYSFIDRYQDIPSDSEIITIYGGTNDWGQSITLKNESNDHDETTVCGALRTILDYYCTNFKTAFIFVITPPTSFSKFEDNSYKNTLELTMRDYAAAIKEVALEYSVPIIDFNSNSGINKFNQNELLEDKVHLKEFANKRLAQIIIEKFNGIIY